jgi:uncharacterized protein YutE (UPF0331/DUF86 family)
VSSALNLDRIAKNKADLLAVQNEVLKIIEPDMKDVISDKKNIYSLKYLLIQAVEGITDTCQHILSRRKGLPCEGYADCIVKAGENGLIKSELANKLRRLADLRNNLVHRYWIIDDEELFSISKANIRDLGEFVSQIDALIAKL